MKILVKLHCLLWHRLQIICLRVQELAEGANFNRHYFVWKQSRTVSKTDRFLGSGSKEKSLCKHLLKIRKKEHHQWLKVIKMLAMRSSKHAILFSCLL